VNPAWVSAVVALVVAGVTVAYWFLRVMWKTFQKVEAFLEDWNGSPETPGHPRRWGVMERLVHLESDNTAVNVRFDTQDAALADIKAEVMYNSGHSLKDTVRAIKIKVDHLDPPGRQAGGP
jgi:hypothetical protein